VLLYDVGLISLGGRGRRMPSSMTAFEQPELFEQQLADLSATFAALPADQVDQRSTGASS